MISSIILFGLHNNTKHYLGPAEKVIFDENLLNICKNTVRHMCIGCI